MGLNLEATDGQTLSFPALTTYSIAVGAYSANCLRRATGAGSVLDLPNLTTITTGTSNEAYVWIEATGGGLVDLPAVTTLRTPASTYGGLPRGVSVSADGAGSTVDLTGLLIFENLAGPSGSILDAQNGGIIQLNPGATTLADVDAVVGAGSTIQVGSLELDGPSTLSGVGTIEGNVTSGGQTFPGDSPGVLTINGDYTQTATGVLSIEIGGRTAGTEVDQFVVTGQATLDGTLAVTLTGGFEPASGDSFEILSFGSRLGDFATRTGLTSPGGRYLQPKYDASSLKLYGNFIVDSTDDAVDDDPGDGAIDDGTGKSTLRAAIMETNALAGADTIFLPAGTYTLSLAGIDEDGSATGDLDVTDHLTIVGEDAATTIIDADQIDRVFHLLPGVTVTLSGVTITGGSVTGTADGGGILNDGTLTVTDGIITDNVSADYGGGIYTSGTATFSSTEISSNTAFNGGGIYAETTLTVTASQITGNSATAFGGGIDVQGTATVTQCTFSSNSAVNGGGLLNEGDTTLTQSEFSDNLANSRGGGAGDAQRNASSHRLPLHRQRHHAARRRGAGIHGRPDDRLGKHLLGQHRGPTWRRHRRHRCPTGRPATARFPAIAPPRAAWAAASTPALPASPRSPVARSLWVQPSPAEASPTTAARSAC